MTEPYDPSVTRSQNHAEQSEPVERPRDTDSKRETILDQLFTVLAQQRRRVTLAYLTETPDERIAVDDLVTHMVAQEFDPEPPPAEHESWTRVRTSLLHQHLPTLADAGLIEFDPHANTIRYQAHILVEDLLASVRTREHATE